MCPMDIKKLSGGAIGVSYNRHQAVNKRFENVSVFKKMMPRSMKIAKNMLIIFFHILKQPIGPVPWRS